MCYFILKAVFYSVILKHFILRSFYTHFLITLHGYYRCASLLCNRSITQWDVESNKLIPQRIFLKNDTNITFYWMQKDKAYNMSQWFRYLPICYHEYS